MPAELTTRGGAGPLVERARRLAAAGERRVLGITGPPGAGKSTLAAALVDALGPAVAALVPMDGFHHAQRVLAATGRADRKGAPDTFDAAGYCALLRRLRERRDAVVLAPEFRRDLEEPVGSALPVPREVPLVVTEGNYLLLREGEWAGLAGLLDETWYVDVPEDLRRDRLVARHRAHGRDAAAARAWALGSDEDNARVVAAGRDRADLLVRPG